ncbi:hypothetical protein BpHYR1_017567 [Brachionus plicatilis]|uniref:Uncharacterized protein n=1 Tax=Brachionus plicatilis TaxID=10195 RepID=A0A3M7RXM3_BRAPC|nr:hypothetical protein BpHYR1_017567 [Brachionus plicatilis]
MVNFNRENQCRPNKVSLTRLCYFRHHPVFIFMELCGILLENINRQSICAPGMIRALTDRSACSSRTLVQSVKKSLANDHSEKMVDVMCLLTLFDLN